MLYVHLAYIFLSIYMQVSYNAVVNFDKWSLKPADWEEHYIVIIL